MRRSLPLLLIAAVVVFYGGVAGVGIAPYYDAITSFVHSATGNPNGSGQLSAAPTPQSGQGGHHDPPAAATPVATLSPRIVIVTPGPSHAQLTQRRLAAEVQHAASTKKPPAGRVNILILGSDNDKKFASYAQPLTQVMIVLSIDTVNHSVTILSIPRDFWVHIPGYQYNYAPDGSGSIGWSKIDVASQLGFPSAACTVERDFGIPINHWLWVGLNGFTKVIDTLNGVTLDVPHPVVDDTYPADTGNASNANDPYGYQRLYIPPGPQHLNGQNALQFVRSRHGDIEGDFGRSSRQQLLLTQLRRMLFDQDGAAIVAQAVPLLHAFQKEMRTDQPIDFNTAVTYYRLLQTVAHTKPVQVILSPPTYSTPDIWQTDYDPLHVTPGTQELTVAPNWTAIDPEITQLFGGQDRTADPQGYCAQVPGASQ